MPDNEDQKDTAGWADSIRVWLLFSSAMIGSLFAIYNAFDDVADQLRDQARQAEQIPELKDRILRLEILIGERYSKKPTVYPSQENTGLIQRGGQ